MTGLLATLLAVVSAWNPPAVAGRVDGMPRVRLIGLVAGALIVGGIAAFTEPILEVLSVSAPTFRTAAGAVLGLTGARWLVAGAPRPDASPSTGVALVDSVTPATVMTSMATTLGDGWGVTMGVLALAVAVTVPLGMRPPSSNVMGGLRRGVGGVAIAAGVALVYAGIRAV